MSSGLFPVGNNASQGAISSSASQLPGNGGGRVWTVIKDRSRQFATSTINFLLAVPIINYIFAKVLRALLSYFNGSGSSSTGSPTHTTAPISVSPQLATTSPAETQTFSAQTTVSFNLPTPQGQTAFQSTVMTLPPVLHAATPSIVPAASSFADSISVPLSTSASQALNPSSSSFHAPLPAASSNYLPTHVPLPRASSNYRSSHAATPSIVPAPSSSTPSFHPMPPRENFFYNGPRPQRTTLRERVAMTESTTLIQRVTIHITSQLLPIRTDDNDKTYYLQFEAKPNQDVEITQNKKNMGLVFCLDASGSMGQGIGSRRETVAETMDLFFDKAGELVGDGKADINTGVIIFDDSAQAVNFNENNKVQLTNNTTLQKVTVRKALYAKNGGTEMTRGLSEASGLIEEMQDENRDAAYALLYLTDGQDDSQTEKVSRASLAPIHERLAQASTSLLALGMGGGHDHNVMRMITTDQRVNGSGAFSSTYFSVDDSSSTSQNNQSTTVGSRKYTVREAIDQVFTQLFTQVIDQIACRKPDGIDSRNFKVLNGRSEGEIHYLGGVSLNNISLKKIIRVVVGNGQVLPSDLGLNLTLIEGREQQVITIPVDQNGPENSDILIAAMEQEIIETLQDSISDISRDAKLEKIEATKQKLIRAGFVNDDFIWQGDAPENMATFQNLVKDLSEAKTRVDRNEVVTQTAQQQQAYMSARSGRQVDTHYTTLLSVPPSATPTNN